jgi:hypothetical protein
MESIHLQATFDQMLDGLPMMATSLDIVRRTATALTQGRYASIDVDDDGIHLERMPHGRRKGDASDGEIAETVTINTSLASAMGDEDPAAFAVRMLCLPSMDERDAALVRSAMKCAIASMDVDERTALMARATAPMRNVPFRIEKGSDDDSDPTLEPDPAIAARIPPVALAYVNRPIAASSPARTPRNLRKPVLYLSGLCASLRGEGRPDPITSMRMLREFDREFVETKERSPLCVVHATGDMT